MKRLGTYFYSDGTAVELAIDGTTLVVMNLDFTRRLADCRAHNPNVNPALQEAHRRAVDEGLLSAGPYILVWKGGKPLMADESDKVDKVVKLPVYGFYEYGTPVFATYADASNYAQRYSATHANAPYTELRVAPCVWNIANVVELSDSITEAYSDELLRIVHDTTGQAVKGAMRRQEAIKSSLVEILGAEAAKRVLAQPEKVIELLEKLAS